MRGNGSVTANGGISSSPISIGGGGGGGRIAVYVSGDEFFSGVIAAHGGYGEYQSGGAGTVYKKYTLNETAMLYVLNDGFCDSPKTVLSTLLNFDALISGQCSTISILGSFFAESLVGDGTGALEISAESSLSGAGNLAISNLFIACYGILNYSSIDIRYGGYLTLTENGSSHGSLGGTYSFETISVRAKGELRLHYLSVENANRSGERIVLDCSFISIEKYGVITSSGEGFSGSREFPTISGLGAGAFDLNAAGGGGYGGTGGSFFLISICFN